VLTSVLRVAPAFREKAMIALITSVRVDARDRGQVFGEPLPMRSVGLFTLALGAALRFMHATDSFSATAFANLFWDLLTVFPSSVPVGMRQSSGKDESSKPEIAGIAEQLSDAKHSHYQRVMGVASTHARAATLWAMFHC